MRKVSMKRQRKAELGKWDNSYPDGSPQRPVKINYPWFNNHQGEPYFPDPHPKFFDPAEVTPKLQTLAKAIWSGYHTMRLTKLPSEYGLGRTGLPFEKYAVIFQKEQSLSTPAMDELWHYLMGIRWATSTAYKSWRDLLKRNELNQLRTPDWAPQADVTSPLPVSASKRSSRVRRRQRKAQKSVQTLERMLKTYKQVVEKHSEADVKEFKDTIDYYFNLLTEKEKKSLEPLMKEVGYTPSVKKKGAKKSCGTKFVGKVTTIPIGPTTSTEEIYELAEEAMTAIYNGRFDAFKLGGYLVVWLGNGWEVFREEGDKSLAFYPDKQQSVYTMVDDWMDDRGWHTKGR